jgi:hypothetical protein
LAHGHSESEGGCEAQHQEGGIGGAQKKTISRLPRKTRTALGKQANKVKRQRRK